MDLGRQRMPNQEHPVIMMSKLPTTNLSLSDLTLHKERRSGGAWAACEYHQMKMIYKKMNSGRLRNECRLNEMVTWALSILILIVLPLVLQSMLWYPQKFIMTK